MKNKVDIEFTKNRSKYLLRQRYATKDYYKEYLESGAQYSMTYLQFKAKKRKQNITKL